MTEAARAIKPQRAANALCAFDLVCACLAPGEGSPPDAGAVDAGLLARVARRHQVSPLVAARLAHAGQPVPEMLRRQADAARHRSIRQLGFTLELIDALEGAGIRVLPIKGVALSHQIFGSPLLRAAVDVDLLVQPQDVGAAWQALARAGLEQVNPPSLLEPARMSLFCRVSKDSLHRHPASGQILELHWRLADELAQPLMPPDDALERLPLATGKTVRVLNKEALFLYLCIHGAAHGWARIKWLADVAALLHGAPDGGKAMWAHAREGGGAIAAGSAIMLAQELLGLAPPAGFKAPRGIRISVLMWLAQRVMRAGGGARELETTPWRGWVEMLAKMLVASSWRARLAVMRRLILSGEDIALIRLPVGLLWLYPALRVPLLIQRRTARLLRLRGLSRVGSTA